MLPSPRAPRQRDADATRARILDSAAEEFSRRGFDGVRLREIAERAEVTVPLLCHHFKDKDSLYAAVVDRAVERFAQQSWVVLKSAQTFERKLVALVHGLVDFLAADPTSTQLLHRELADGGERMKPLAERWLRPLRDGAVEQIRAAQRIGKFRRELDAELLVLHVVAAAVYPSIAGSTVAAVWGEDPLSPGFIERRKTGLAALVMALLT